MANPATADITKFKKLTDVEHVLLRPGRYIGSVEPITRTTWALTADKKFERRELTWNPGFLKLFDEIVSNSIDHSKRPEGKHLNTIRIDIERATGVISVHDNGGIPVQIHPEYDLYVPALIFGHLRTGSNFDDSVDSDVTGQNGEGASLTNIFSDRFTVETSDGTKKVVINWTENMMKCAEPKVSDVKGVSPGYTKITYLPDYAHLGMTPNLLADHADYDKLVKRVYDAAGCNPNLKFYLNGERIQFGSFKDYVKLYGDEFEYDDTPDWQVGIGKSEDGFDHVSFVNSTETFAGGTHVDYVGYAIAYKVRDFIRKKHKVEVRPSDVLNHLRVFINARIIRPRYSSQTKETLITESKNYQTSWTPSDKFIQRVLKSDLVARVVAWAEAKAAAKALQEVQGMMNDAKKSNPKRITKLQDANLAGKEPAKCTLFLMEGDSASSVKSVGDRDTMGFLALRGVPINLQEAGDLIREKRGKDGKVEKVENVEFKNIMIAMGLQLGVKVKSISQLRYARLAIMTDADHDGAGHITGLLINNLFRFWPELFELGVVHRFITPLVKVWDKGSKHAPTAFYTEQEYHDWLAKRDPSKTVPPSKYYKGLGTNGEEEFAEYLKAIDRHLIQLRIESDEDRDVIGLVFGKTEGSADRRKAWLNLAEEGTEFDLLTEGE